MIKRNLESKILSLLETFPAIAILGPRQVGKTTLAKEIREKLPGKSIYIDLENPLDQGMLTNPIEFFTSQENQTIIIDEIQRQPELFPVLRSVIDQNRVPARFILLGSASPKLLFLSSETLAGRIAYTELTPFLQTEVSDHYIFRDIWFRGGFPGSLLTEDPETREMWYNSFIMSYIERDLNMLGLGSPSKDVSLVFSMVSILSGNLLNISSIAKSLEISVTKVKNILSFFEQSFMIRLLLPWHFNSGKRLIKSPKIYMRDSGILHFMNYIKTYDQLLKHPSVGLSWEGYVIEQIIRHFGDKFQYYFYRTADGTECDLVLARGMDVISCIEIKFTDHSRLSKGFTTAINDLKTKLNFIIIPTCEIPYQMNDHTHVTSLEVFLVNEFNREY